MRWAAIVVLLALVAVAAMGCGSSPQKPPAASVAKQRAASVAKQRVASRSSRRASHKAKKPRKPRSVIPQRCAKNRHLCLPPKAWVKRLCEDVYPDVALHMFRPGTPWVRLYMRANAQPFNASGGMSLMGDKMKRGEEVIALWRRNARSGVQVSDISGFDVLRWNGACATIHDGDFTTISPDEVLHARIEWRQIGLELRKALEANPDIAETYEARRKHCRGMSIGLVSAECEDYSQRLVDEVVRYVRSGAKLPKPAKAPRFGRQQHGSTGSASN